MPALPGIGVVCDVLEVGLLPIGGSKNFKRFAAIISAEFLDVESHALANAGRGSNTREVSFLEIQPYQHTLAGWRFWKNFTGADF